MRFRTRCIWLFCSVLGLSLAGIARLNSSERPNTAAANPREAVTVLISNGDPLGSGVVVRQAAQGFWVVTNRHVLEGLKAVCIETTDGLRRLGVPVPDPSPDLDLAFVWVAAADYLPPVVRLSSELPEAMAVNYPVVVATGFPSSTDPTVQKASYTEREGLLLPLLKGAIEDGYLLTYTSQVAKGMSGGGIFNQKNQLIGINATHPEPLWDMRWKDKTGKVIPEFLNRQLSLVALGISSIQIAQELQKQLHPQESKKEEVIKLCKS